MRGSRLTRRGFTSRRPDSTRPGRRWSTRCSDADEFPALREIDIATGSDRPLVDRFAGTQLSVRDGLVVFDQLDLSDNVAWRSDLYAADMRTGRSYRLTSDQRLLEPDVSPDGKRLACVRPAEDGRRELAFFTMERDAGGRLSLSPLSVPVAADSRSTFGGPRWSPDGRSLAVERRRLDGPSDIVVFDVADGRERVIASSARARNIAPAWMPDGRTILFASDRADRSFQVYAATIDGGDLRRITSVPGGALSPEVSPDGRTLVYVGSDATGYDLFALPLEDAMASAVLEPPAAQSAAEPGSAAAEATPQARTVGSAPADLEVLSPPDASPSLLDAARRHEKQRRACRRQRRRRGRPAASFGRRLPHVALRRNHGCREGRTAADRTGTPSTCIPAGCRRFYVAASDTTSFLAVASPAPACPRPSFASRMRRPACSCPCDG